MLPKKNRAGTREVDKIFKEGGFLNSPSLTFKFLLRNNSTPPKISFIAPKGVARKAVQRNFLRRLGYGVLRKHISHLPAGIIGAFVFKKFQKDTSIIDNEIKNILDKVN